MKTFIIVIVLLAASSSCTFAPKKVSTGIGLPRSQFMAEDPRKEKVSEFRLGIGGGRSVGYSDRGDRTWGTEWGGNVEFQPNSVIALGVFPHVWNLDSRLDDATHLDFGSYARFKVFSNLTQAFYLSPSAIGVSNSATDTGNCFLLIFCGKDDPPEDSSAWIRAAEYSISAHWTLLTGNLGISLAPAAHYTTFRSENRVAKVSQHSFEFARWHYSGQLVLSFYGKESQINLGGGVASTKGFGENATGQRYEPIGFLSATFGSR